MAGETFTLKIPARPVVAVGLAVGLSWAGLLLTAQDPVTAMMVMGLCFALQIVANFVLMRLLRSWALGKTALLVAVADLLIIAGVYAPLMVYAHPRRAASVAGGSSVYTTVDGETYKVEWMTHRGDDGRCIPGPLVIYPESVRRHVSLVAEDAAEAPVYWLKYLDTGVSHGVEAGHVVYLPCVGAKPDVLAEDWDPSVVDDPDRRDTFLRKCVEKARPAKTRGARGARVPAMNGE